MKTARQCGYKGVMVWPSAGGGLGEFQIAGQAADGVLLTQDWDWNGRYLGTEMKKSGAAYNSQYSGYHTMLYLDALDSVRMIKSAIELSGNVDTTALRDVMRRVQGDGVYDGKGKLGPVGDRDGVIVLHLMPVAKYDSAGNKYVNVAQAVPPDKWQK